MSAFESYAQTSGVQTNADYNALAENLMDSITSLQDYLDTKLPDLENNNLMKTSLIETIYNELFLNASGQTIGKIYSQVLGSTLHNYKTETNEPLGSRTFGEILTQLLGGTISSNSSTQTFGAPSPFGSSSAPSGLAAIISTRLTQSFTNYQQKQVS